MIERLKAARARARHIYREHGFVELLRRIFVLRTNNGFVQLVRYGIVGVVAAAFDTGTLLLLTNVFGVSYLVAGTVGFAVGTVVNYAMSVTWVFRRTSQPYVEMALFVLIGAAGLVVNDVTLWAGQAWFGLDLFWAKMLAIVVGFLWNFILRKILFDRLGAYLAKRAAQQATAEPAPEADALPR
ncbi:GtrA family protein [Microbacterium sp. X-17]|uniref:GtrA family protein n=1 Tax=Microbacterium sp. X-17 TaxID=3144404 RepID=UPI0031F49EF6